MSRSPFYGVEARLAALGWRRGHAEPIRAWLDGLANQSVLDSATLQHLAWLHYKLRYDPEGLDAQQGVQFARDAAAWLDRHPSSDLSEKGREGDRKIAQSPA